MRHADILIRQLEAVRAQVEAALDLLRAGLAADPPPDDPPPAEFTHTERFERVRCRGRAFNFSPKQRVVVARLWEARQKGRPEMSQRTLLDAADSECDSLDELFKRHPAWGTLISRVAPGVYALDLVGDGSIREVPGQGWEVVQDKAEAA